MTLLRYLILIDRSGPFLMQTASRLQEVRTAEQYSTTVAAG